MVDVSRFTADIPLSVDDIRFLQHEQCKVTVLPLDHKFKMFPSRDGLADERLILWVSFMGKTRPLKLNEKNTAILQSLCLADDTKDWSGKSFYLVPAKKGAVEWIEVRLK